MSTKNKVSIAINLKKDGKTVFYTRSSETSKILELLRSKKIPEWTLGYVRVTYNRQKEHYNHAYCNSRAEIKKHLSVDQMMDPYLIRKYCT